ncbi:MAG: GTP-binding protein, partial [Pirellulales bacterium]|nr:GTP-binding protein [Pirellulales bacterium]
MSKFQAKDIRNVALCGHGSCGKTTIVDKLLPLAGAVSGQNSVDDGTSICDFDDEEKHHKYSIEAALVHFEHKGKRFNVFDTPGYPDYIGQTIGAMAGVDTAAIVINAHAGIAVNTRRVFKEAGERGLGRMIIINHMDDENVDYPGLIANIKEIFGNQCVQLNVPLGSGSDFKGVASTLKVPDDTAGALVDPNEISEALIESIIEVDEEVTERYFEGQLPT